MCCIGTKTRKREVMKMKKLIALLLAALMCLSLCACGEDDTPDESQSAPNPSTDNVGSPTQSTPQGTESTPVTTTPPVPGLELSDDLADFTVSIEGVVYQLPCGVDQLLNNGWHEDTGREYTYEVAANKSVALELWNESGKSISIAVWNPGPDTKTYNECMIWKISESIWASDSEAATVLVAGGFEISADSSEREVIAAFGGEENEHYSNTTSYGLHYDYEAVDYLFKGLSESWNITVSYSAIRELEE